LIYRAKYVLPMVGDSSIPGGEVLVRDGKIIAVGTRLDESYPGEEARDLAECVLMPGFVNAHSHIEPTFMRHRLDGLDLWDWLEALGFRKDKSPPAELLRWSAILGAAECARSGVTCVGDSSFAGLSPEALDEVGLRGIGYIEFFGQSAGTRYAEKLEGKLRLANELDARTSDRIAIGISPHSIYTSNRQTLELCAGLDIPVSLHLAETRAETEYSISGTGPIADMRARMGYAPMASGLSPVRYLSETGLLRPGVCLAHCVHVTSEEAELIAGSGASVAHCARSNAYLGVGIAPLVGFLEADAVVGLGSDSAASCGRLDFFEEIRFALALQRAGTEDAGVLTAKSVLNLATMGGAAALGLSDRIGSLEPGKRADMIAVDVGDMLPGADPWLTVISKSPADVRMTLVDGAEIARDGLPVRVDLAECRGRLTEVIDQLGVG
jgi:cytosine/adenosine deaminase-related metal-dependent hydrolase